MKFFSKIASANGKFLTKTSSKRFFLFFFRFQLSTGKAVKQGVASGSGNWSGAPNASVLLFTRIKVDFPTHHFFFYSQ